MNIIERLVFNANSVFNGNPWFGISVLDKTAVIDYRIVNEKPLGTSHSIAELVEHMSNWKTFVIEKLNNNKEFEIPIDSELDWPKTKIADDDEWQNLIQKYTEKHHALIAAIELKNTHDLEKEVPGKNYDVHFLTEGIIQHDIYHLGQIAILNKMLTKS